MRGSLWLACAIALSICLAAPVLAQGNGNSNAGGGGGQGAGQGGGQGGGPPGPAPEPQPAPAPEPEPEPQPAPAPEPQPAPEPEAEPEPASTNPPGHDPNGPGNSENAPGHDPEGPGNSENAQPEPPAPDGSQPPGSAGANGASGEGGATGGGRASGEHGPPDDPGAPDARGRPEDAGQEGGAGRGRNETGRPETPPGRERANETRGAERAAERRGAREANANGGGPDPQGGAGAGGNGQGLGGGVGASEGEIPAAQLERSSVSENAVARVAAVHVRREQRDVDVARGDVRIEASGVEDPSQAFLVIIHPNGTEETLAAGSVEAPWNTTGYENGHYTVEVREHSSSGDTVTVASARILVENPRATPAAIVAAVATGTVVSAGAGAIAARGIDALSMLKSAAGRATGEALTSAAEERLRLKTAGVAAVGVNWTRRSMILLLAAGAMLAFFKVFADRDDVLLALPIAFLAAFVYTVGDYGAEWMIARSSGAQARFRIWAPGALSLALSSLLFRAPFGYPGYVSETDVGHPAQRELMRQKAGLRAMAFMGMGIALTLPFLVVGSMWRWELAEYGIGLALMMGAAGAMPFSPMPGKDVWMWSKGAWAGVAGVLLLLYMLWQLALLPIGLLVAAAIVGGAAFLMGLRMLRPRAA